MELTFGYFQLFKYSAFALTLFMFYILLKNEWFKTCGVMAFLFVVFLLTSPVKHDGTDSVKQSKINIIQSDNKHNEVVINTTKVEKKELSFLEKMKIEEQRSTEENNKLKQELGL